LRIRIALFLGLNLYGVTVYCCKPEIVTLDSIGEKGCIVEAVVNLTNR
jgi:hypothetical protein